MKVPRIPIFSGLEGIDKRIQEIQKGLAANVSWLQYSFGRCDSVLRNNEAGDTMVVPVCYIDSRTDPYDMRPWLDDSHTSYGFCDLDDTPIPEYFENFAPNAFPTWTYAAAWIFVLNLNDISTDWKVAKSTARQDLLEFFSRRVRLSGIYRMTGIFEKDIEQIFDGYDIEDPLILLRDNYAAFRVEGEIIFKQDC